MTSGAHSHDQGPTSPSCYANNTPWLTTLAYCINDTCADTVEAWVLEKYWADQNTGDPNTQPKWTYQETLAQMRNMSAPKKGFAQLGDKDVLEETVTYDKETWESYRGTLWAFEESETLHSRTA